MKICVVQTRPITGDIEANIERHKSFVGVAVEMGAEVYVASVARFRSGTEKSLELLAEIAYQYSMMVMIVNSVGLADGLECAGRTAVWNKDGKLLAQLNDTDEGILVFDTETEEVVGRYYDV